MNTDPFIPHHINANPSDLAGNNGIGRIILLPGSDGRAKEIAKRFNNLVIKSHPRGHHLYLGEITHEGSTIEVAAISSGMGCPSMEIILHELFHLGGKRFLRIGTAGSLQANVKPGDLVNVQASVRDESTTADYIPIAIPAVASIECITAIAKAALKLNLTHKVHTGIVHCKSSLYAKEFGAGPNALSNQTYLHLLSDYGILASEMETASLFIQSQFYNHQLMQKNLGRVLCGAILAIVSTEPNLDGSMEQEMRLMEDLVDLALESIKCLAKNA